MPALKDRKAFFVALAENLHKMPQAAQEIASRTKKTKMISSTSFAALPLCLLVFATLQGKSQLLVFRFYIIPSEPSLVQNSTLFPPTRFQTFYV